MGRAATYCKKKSDCGPCLAQSDMVSQKATAHELRGIELSQSSDGHWLPEPQRLRDPHSGYSGDARVRDVEAIASTSVVFALEDHTVKPRLALLKAFKHTLSRGNNVCV